MSTLLEPPIVLRGELSLADVLTANRMLQAPKRRNLVASAYIFLASIAASVAMAVRTFDEDWGDWTLIGVVVVFFAIYFIPLSITRYRLRRSWKRKEGVFHPVETTIANEGLLITQPHTTIQVEWPRFVAALTSPTVILLFPSEGWILFGRSRFADERDWNRFKAYVDDRYPIKPRLV
jgi:hypothetical protein